MFLSVFQKSMANDTLTKSFWHWAAPVLSALVSVLAIVSVVFVAGGASQRLTMVEEQHQKLEKDAVKHVELDYRLDSIEKTVNEIRQDQKEMNRRK